ncbi:hypothetical protein A7981_02445 [Methylovorus sp. MM2]|uniref:DciA family protein n=1 Tax=Methylovorus sp. MM2 TaxID=1848038 RepID=UPI0007E13F2A|nr:DciA family protein [Methylovorus sp. MM2]OAM52362.1 hypothetical protein A7981_02445 [Methylovorus sp. MM2]
MRQFKAVFRGSPELLALSGHAQDLSASQQAWNTVTPEPLRPHTQAGTLKHKRLTVYAANGAVAAKIKLLLPSLLTKLQKQGLEVTSIRVEVQVQSGARKTDKNIRKLSEKAATSLGKLADELSGSELGDALARLSSRT